MTRRRKKDDTLKTSLKIFIVLIFSGFVVYLIGNRAVSFLKTAEIFKIKEVVKSPSLQFIRSRHLDRLKGQNIFEVDLAGIQRRVQVEYPSVDRLRVTRQFPNRIFVAAEKRDPYVVVSLGNQDVVLDERGVVLSAGVPAKGKLPYISGVDDGGSVRPGKRLSGQKAAVALEMINAVRVNEYLQKFAVTSLDMTNTSKILLYFNNAEIILDRFNVNEKINTLGLLLSDAGVPIEQINYIDLRFKEPVLKKK